MDPVLDKGVDSFKQAAEVGAVSLRPLGERHLPSQPPRKEGRVPRLPVGLPGYAGEFRTKGLGKGTVQSKEAQLGFRGRLTCH